MHNVYEAIYEKIEEEKIETIEKEKKKNEPPIKVRRKTQSRDTW